MKTGLKEFVVDLYDTRNCPFEDLLMSILNHRASLSYLRVICRSDDGFILEPDTANNINHLLSNIKHISFTRIHKCSINAVSVAKYLDTTHNITYFNHIEKMSIDILSCNVGMSEINEYLCDGNKIIFYKLKMLEIIICCGHIVPCVETLMTFQKHMEKVNPNCPLFIKVRCIKLISEVDLNVPNIFCRWLGAGLIDCIFAIRHYSTATKLTNHLQKQVNHNLGAQEQSSIIAKRFDNPWCQNYSFFVIQMSKNEAKHNQINIELYDMENYQVVVSNCQENVTQQL